MIGENPALETARLQAQRLQHGGAGVRDGVHYLLCRLGERGLHQRDAEYHGGEGDPTVVMLLHHPEDNRYGGEDEHDGGGWHLEHPWRG